MSRSPSTELSYESLHEPSERDSSNIPENRTPTQAAELLPDPPDFHAPDTTLDPQPDNRLSVVSAVSLEPRRRSRHHHNRHSHNSHIHRELAHMLSVSSRDTKELRRGLSVAFDKLDQSRVRASHAEKLALDTLLRVREAEEERANAMRQASTVREELGKYKALLDNAHGEIRRAQQLLQDQEELRYEAEATAARARDNARLMKQRRLVDLAREQGRNIGFNEGIQAGQRIGYHEGQSPSEDGGVYQNEGARFREIFDESRYQLDEFDQFPPIQHTYLNPLSPHDIEGPLPTPLPRRQVYPRLQGQFGGPGSAIDATNPASQAPYAPMSATGVQRTSSTDSSSTTTLPAAPTTQHVSSRAPPPMPTIPEVPSTEMGSVSWGSRSPRNSPRTQSHTQITPQVSANAGILPSVVPFSQGGVAFEPQPGIVNDAPSGLVSGNAPESGAHIYESPSPRRAFDNPSILNNGTDPNVPRSPVHETFSTATGAMQSPAQERFETFPEAVRSPAREHFGTFPEATRSPARQPFETFPEATRSPARQHFETFPDATRSPARQHFETFPEATRSPATRHFETFPGAIRSPAREHFGTFPGAIQSPAREHFETFPENIRSPAREHPEASPRAIQTPVREHFETSRGAIPSPVQERFSNNHSQAPRATRTHPDSVRFVDPESTMRPSSRSMANGVPPPQRDGPPRRRPIPQMPAPLAPQASANAPYAYGSHSVAQRGRSSGSDNRMPRGASSNAASNSASDLYPRSSQTIPSSAERPVRIDDTSSSLHQTERAQEQRARAMSPGISGEQRLDPGATHDPRLTTATPVFPGDFPADQLRTPQRTPQNLPPRVHVQIPPTRYSAPNSASPRLATPPATGIHNQLADSYSSGATSPNPNVRVSGSANQSPHRFPPTLYNEPQLQRQPTSTVDYERDRRVSSPALPVPSRDPRGTSPGIARPSTDRLNGNSYTARPRTAITSPTDTLPVRAPSVSPRPSPAAFAQPTPPPQSATPRRAASPNPLPRGASPAPLPRASSPAPLPIRSPSVRSTHIHRSTSDVSLPGAPGSPYVHYNPNEEADIAVLASSSRDKLRAPSR